MQIAMPVNELALVKKFDFRIIPFIWVLYLFNFLDRSNLANVHTDFKEDLGLSEIEYTLGVGIFFVGYVIFEIPSNLMLKKARPSRWISRIMVSWGIISTCTAFVTNFAGYMVCRFLLGVMEAGFFPGIIYYLTFWYKKDELALRQSIFFTAATVAGGVAGLLAFGILRMEGFGGLAGWQWVFLIEGIPSIILGIVTWFYLPDFPSTAGFLTEDEREVACNRLEKHVHTTEFSSTEFRSTLTDPDVWLFALIYTCVANPSYGIIYFLPSLVESFGYDKLISNLLTVPVYIAATVSTISVAYHSDRKKERPLHIFVCVMVATLGYALLGFVPEREKNGIAFAATFLCAIGNFPAVVLTLTWLTNSMKGSTAAATATALVVSVGNIGAFFTPQIFGWVSREQGTYAYALGAMAVVIFVGGVAILLLRWRQMRRGGQQASLETRHLVGEETDLPSSS